MAFEPVKLVHPKTGAVVIATTPVDLTNFRFNDGYVAADTAALLVAGENGEAKYPGLVDGLKQVEKIEADEKSAEASGPEKPETVEQTPSTGGDAKVDAKVDSKPSTGGTAAKPATGNTAAAK